MSFNKTNFTCLEDILNSNVYYNIPDYQRAYSWDKEQIDTLLSDLIQDYLNKNEKHYFCGSIVLLEPNKQNNRFDIIDGQQRLTTFILLFATLKSLYLDKIDKSLISIIEDSIKGKYGKGNRVIDQRNSSNLIKIKPNNHSNYFDFNNILEQNIDFTNEKLLKNNKYLENVYFIKEYFEDKKNENDLIKDFKETNINEFINYLLKNIDFVVVVVDDLDSAINIFNVLNDRGLALKSSDILKSLMMSKLNNEEKEIFKETWSAIELKLGDDLDKVFNYYTFYAITENPTKRYDKHLIECFKDRNILSEIEEIDKFANAYKNIISDDNLKIHSIRYIDWTYCLAIITIAKYKNFSKMKELLDVLIAYYYQNKLAGHTLTKIKQTSFNIMKALKSNKTIEYIKKLCKDNIDKNDTTKKFKYNLQDYVDNKKWIKPLLLLLEYNRRENSDFIEINNKLHLEHILPQTIEGTDWCKDFSKEQHEKNVHRLGNLTLLSMKKNEEIKNFNFKKKKEAYYGKKVSNIIITQDLNNYEKWTSNEIELREKELIKIICEKLDIFN